MSARARSHARADSAAGACGRGLGRSGPAPAPLRQRGMALLVAILLVALGTIIAAAVAYENVMTARRGTATYAFDQALLIGEGAEALAAYGLRLVKQSPAPRSQGNGSGGNSPGGNGQTGSSQDIYVGQGWDKTYGPIEVVPGVMLEASLEDLQGRFNLNNLVRPDGRPDPLQLTAFVNLLELTGLEPRWAGYLVDWIDADGQPSSPDGAEDSTYTGLTPPYRTPNRYITSTTELLALPGFGRERYLKLAPYVAALPYGSKINVCTASGQVLDAFIGNGKTDFSSDPEQLAKNRTAAGACFPTKTSYGAAFDPRAWQGQSGPAAGLQPGVQAGTSPGSPSGTQGGAQSVFVQTSVWFRLASFITIGSTEFHLYSLLYQDTTDAVRPIQRSFTPD